MADAAVDQSFEEQNIDEVPEDMEPQEDFEPQQDFEPEQGWEPQQDLEAQQDLENQQSLEPEENSEKVDDDENLKAGVVENKWPGWPGDSVFRILVPAQKVGGIIGRKGEFIKKLVEETRARIKILDGPPGTPERAVIISAKEEPDSPLPPAIDGLLRVHQKVVCELDGESPAAQPGGKITTRLLVPASQTGSLIGKHGATVKTIQDESGCIVRVLSPEDVPVFALQDDRVIEVVGELSSVLKAVELIGSHLRKFLVDHSIIPLFEMHMRANPPPPPPMEHQMPPAPHQPWGRPQGFRPNAGWPPHPYGRPNHQYMPPPPRQQETYYAPPDMPPPMDQQPPYGQHYPHHGVTSYGREASMAHNTPPAPTVVKQITQQIQIQIPLSYADMVIGEGGSTISYIRRSSGATVTVQETRGVPGEMTVEISGTASQVQTAQQLVQNYIAEAAAPSQPQVAPVDQVYGSYANPGHSGGYDSVYGTNYGY